jgi:Transposase DDE domain
MPYPANAAQRHKFPKAQYQVKNWGEYDRALQERGSLTLWITPEAMAAWHPLPSGRRGRSRYYSDVAIETGHLLRLAFGRPWRQTEGLLRSIAALLGVSLAVPDHTTFSRRSVGLSLAAALPRTAEPVHVVIDSTGLKSMEPASGRGRSTVRVAAGRGASFTWLWIPTAARFWPPS